MSAAPHRFAPRRALRLRGVSWRIVGDLGRVRSRQTPSGETRYFLDFRPLGRVYSVRDALGEQPLTTREEADRLLSRIRARIEDGQHLDVVLGLLRPDGSMAVEKRAEKWLAEKKRQADAGTITGPSYDRIAGEVRRYWGPWTGVPVRAIRAGHVADWATWLAESGLAPSTVRCVVFTFRAFLAWLAEREEIDRVPKMPRIKVPEHIPKIMPQAAQEAVLAAIPEAERGVYLLLVDLALRPNEARAMAPADFERDEAGLPWVTVRRAKKGPKATDPVGPTKTGTVRRIPATERVMAWVEQHGGAAQPLEPLFGHISSWTLNREWKVACDRAGVARAPVRESTRHSTATRWRRSRPGQLEDVRDLLGHTDSATTERYAKPDRAQLVDFVRPVPSLATRKPRKRKHS